MEGYDGGEGRRNTRKGKPLESKMKKRRDERIGGRGVACLWLEGRTFHKYRTDSKAQKTRASPLSAAPPPQELAEADDRM